MIRTASVTKLRDHLAETIDALDREGVIMVVRHSKPAAYLVSPALFARLWECLENWKGRADYERGQAVDGEEACL